MTALFAEQDPAMNETLAKQRMRGKLIEPEQVASVVAFLVSDQRVDDFRSRGLSDLQEHLTELAA